MRVIEIVCVIVWITVMMGVSTSKELRQEIEEKPSIVERMLQRNTEKKIRRQLKEEELLSSDTKYFFKNNNNHLLSAIEKKNDKSIIDLLTQQNLHYSWKPCMRVSAMTNDDKKCLAFELLPLDSVHCESDEAIVVPKIYHAIDATEKPSRIVLSNAYQNPEYRLNYHNDDSALEYIKTYCGEEVAQAFSCLIPAAYRADIFRFCALYAEGGLYLDADLIPIKSFETLYSPCSSFSLGHDFSNIANEGKQMKIVAAQPGHEIALCMIENIVENVKRREKGYSPLSLSGPHLLHECYLTVQRGERNKVAITYLDTRGAAYPYSGMRTMDSLLAFEVPLHNFKRHSSIPNYHNLYGTGEIYDEYCTI